jgi:DNA invertase Pin-like site-specific DNA recombinase
VSNSVRDSEPTSKGRVIGYIRVSTDQQASEGVSLEAQKEKIRAYCTALDLELVDIISDNGYSAKTIERPGLSAALSRLRAGAADILLVAKLDRLTRSVKDLGQLVDTYFLPGRYSLLSIGDSIDTRTASGRLVLNVLASVAQWEREAISERTSEALRHLKAQGVHIGATAYGAVRLDESDANGRRRIVPVAEHARVIARMQELRKSGLTLSAICGILNQDGIPSPRGGTWQPTVVRTILRRAAGEAPPSPARRKERKARIQKTREGAAQRATQLRNLEYSLRKIGQVLYREGYRPPRGGLWHAAMVADLLRLVPPNQAAPAGKPRE